MDPEREPPESHPPSQDPPRDGRPADLAPVSDPDPDVAVAYAAWRQDRGGAKP